VCMSVKAEGGESRDSFPKHPSVYILGLQK
jgi:hypothetical protein